jgi:transposase
MLHAPTAIRERRRTLRYRNLLVRQMVQMKIKISTLLMEAGISYNKQRLHKAVASANYWPPTPTSTKACARCSVSAGRRWCG